MGRETWEFALVTLNLAFQISTGTSGRLRASPEGRCGGRYRSSEGRVSRGLHHGRGRGGALIKGEESAKDPAKRRGKEPSARREEEESEVLEAE